MAGETHAPLHSVGICVSSLLLPALVHRSFHCLAFCPWVGETHASLRSAGTSFFSTPGPILLFFHQMICEPLLAPRRARAPRPPRNDTRARATTHSDSPVRLEPTPVPLLLPALARGGFPLCPSCLLRWGGREGGGGARGRFVGFDYPDREKIPRCSATGRRYKYSYV